MLIIDSPHYFASAILMAIGFYTLLSGDHMMKKLLGLGIFQTAVLLFFIATGWVKNSAPPIIGSTDTSYTNPLPQVLMLTAIVVGVAMLAVGLALMKKIKSAYGSVVDSEINKIENEGR